MTARKIVPERPTLIRKVEVAYEYLLDEHFGHTLNPDAAPDGSGTPDDAPPPNMLDQLKLLNSITAFIELKHKLHPEEADDGIGTMVTQLRGETVRAARRAKGENGAGTPALLHRADEPTGAPSDEGGDA